MEFECSSDASWPSVKEFLKSKLFCGFCKLLETDHCLDRNYKGLFAHLGFSHQKVSQLKNNPLQQGLKYWIKKNGKNATLQGLCDALELTRRLDALEVVYHFVLEYNKEKEKSVWKSLEEKLKRRLMRSKKDCGLEDDKVSIRSWCSTTSLDSIVSGVSVSTINTIDSAEPVLCQVEQKQTRQCYVQEESAIHSPYPGPINSTSTKPESLDSCDQCLVLYGNDAVDSAYWLANWLRMKGIASQLLDYEGDTLSHIVNLEKANIIIVVLSSGLLASSERILQQGNSTEFHKDESRVLDSCMVWLNTEIFNRNHGSKPRVILVSFDKVEMWRLPMLLRYKKIYLLHKERKDLLRRIHNCEKYALRPLGPPAKIKPRPVVF